MIASVIEPSDDPCQEWGGDGSARGEAQELLPSTSLEGCADNEIEELNVHAILLTARRGK